MPTTFQFSPSQTSVINVTISSTPTIIKGAEGIPDFGPECGTYETTAINDSAKSFGKDIADPGEFTLTGIWDSMDPGQAYLLSSSTTANAIEAFTVTFAKKQSAATAATAAFSALVLSFKVNATQKKAQTFSAKIKLTGPVTFVAAA